MVDSYSSYNKVEGINIVVMHIFDDTFMIQARKDSKKSRPKYIIKYVLEQRPNESMPPKILEALLPWNENVKERCRLK